MLRIKSLLRTLFFPPAPLLMILAPASAVMVIYALADPRAQAVVKYISYFTSAYALTAVCLRAPMILEYLNSFKQRNRYVNRYVNDIRWRVSTTLHGSIITNSLYTALQLIAGLFLDSSWHLALAGYYAMLAIMRWVLLRYVSANEPGGNLRAEYLRYRFCGITMLIMNQALIAIVSFIVIFNHGIVHSPIITIAMAAYTFTSISLAIKNLIKFRKYASPVLSATKVLSLTSALVSLLSLETSMLSSFGDNDPAFRRIITGITGFAVCAIELVMAAAMLISSTRGLKHIN